IFVVHLMSYVDADGKAFTDLDSALIPPHTSSSGAEWYPDYDQAGLTSSIAPFLRGERGAGVAGAKLHATLVLGNAKVGQHAVAQIDAVTDAGGSAAFLVSAGTHPE